MKDLSLLVWLAQLGLSVAVPPAGFILLAMWLRDRFDLGIWVIWVAVVIGFICALDGFRISLKALDRITNGKKKNDPPIFFNDHD